MRQSTPPLVPMDVKMLLKTVIRKITTPKMEVCVSAIPLSLLALVRVIRLIVISLGFTLGKFANTSAVISVEKDLLRLLIKNVQVVLGVLLMVLVVLNLLMVSLVRIRTLVLVDFANTEFRDTQLVLDFSGLVILAFTPMTVLLRVALEAFVLDSPQEQNVLLMNNVILVIGVASTTLANLKLQQDNHALKMINVLEDSVFVVTIILASTYFPELLDQSAILHLNAKWVLPVMFLVFVELPKRIWEMYVMTALSVRPNWEFQQSAFVMLEVAL